MFLDWQQNNIVLVEYKIKERKKVNKVITLLVEIISQLCDLIACLCSCIGVINSNPIKYIYKFYIFIFSKHTRVFND